MLFWKDLPLVIHLFFFFKTNFNQQYTIAIGRKAIINQTQLDCYRGDGHFKERIKKLAGVSGGPEQNQGIENCKELVNVNQLYLLAGNYLN